MLQGGLFGVFGIAEGDVLEVHAAVHDRIVGGTVGNIRLLVKDLVDTHQGGLCAGHGHDEPGQHSQGVDGLGGVADHADQLTGQQAGGLKDDLSAAEQQQQDGTQPHNAHLDGAGQGEQPSRGQVGLSQILCRAFKALRFVIAADVGLDHTAADEVFLHRPVHGVHLDQHGAEAGLADLHQYHQHKGQHGNGNQEDQRQVGGDGKGHNGGHSQHDGGAAYGAQKLKHGGAHSVDIGGGAGNEAGGGEAVRVGKGKALNFIQEAAAQIFCKPLPGNGGEAGAEQPEDHRETGHAYHDAAGHEHKGVAVVNEGLGEQELEHEVLLPVETAVDNGGHQQGDKDLQDDLAPAADRCRDGPAPVFSEAFPQMAEQRGLFFFFDGYRLLLRDTVRLFVRDSKYYTTSDEKRQGKKRLPQHSKCTAAAIFSYCACFHFRQRRAFFLRLRNLTKPHRKTTSTTAAMVRIR